MKRKICFCEIFPGFVLYSKLPMEAKGLRVLPADGAGLKMRVGESGRAWGNITSSGLLLTRFSRQLGRRNCSFGITFTCFYVLRRGWVPQTFFSWMLEPVL
jgi:hypothetical protein